jgi:hypothetical protein
MKKPLRQNNRLSISQLIWNTRINYQFLPHAGYMGNGGEIHLLLGINGTGINHLAQLLSQALPNNHYINYPLAKFEPKLTFSNLGDRLATPYHKKLATDHPLNRVYRIYAERYLLKTTHNLQPIEDDTSQHALLILKETHALLATEALLRELKCHVLFYASDPVILAEQIFQREGVNTSYLDLESEAVMDHYFLKRFLAHDLHAVLHAYKLIQRLPRHQRRMQIKIFAISLIQHMFRMLAARYPELVTVIDFALIENDPKHLQFPLINWLGPNSLEHSKHLLDTASFTPDGKKVRRWTRSWPESINIFEILSAEDVRMAYQLIINRELIHDEVQPKICNGS